MQSGVKESGSGLWRKRPIDTGAAPAHIIVCLQLLSMQITSQQAEFLTERVLITMAVVMIDGGIFYISNGFSHHIVF